MAVGVRMPKISQLEAPIPGGTGGCGSEDAKNKSVGGSHPRWD